MKLLLTGGSGFIGRNLKESFLSRKYDVVAPTRAQLDLMDEEAVREYVIREQFDVIIHAAAKPGHRAVNDPTQILLTNTRIFFNLARNADYFGRLIITGSGAIYDTRNYTPKMQEDYFDTHVPVDEHGLSKYVIQKCIEGRPGKFVDLRIFGIYGKYEEYAIRFISNMICKALFDLPLTITRNRRFSYLYVDDLPTVMDFFISHEPQHVAYNVTPDEVSELYQIAEIVLAVSGKQLPIVVSQDGYGSDYTGNNSRLKREMGTLRFTPLKKGVAELYSWYRDNRHRIDTARLLVDR